MLVTFGPLRVKTSKELERKCVPQLFLGWLLGIRWSAIGQFVPRP